MICPNCGASNEDAYQFCMKCGKPLTTYTANATEHSINPERVTTSDQPTSQRMSGQRKKDLLKEKITPAVGEVSVRTYYCTYYISRLLGLEAWGYLGVTNKRVIFQALGTSNAGSSVIQSELPIADVSGISSYKGTFFSFGHLAMAFIASSAVANMLLLFLGSLGTVIGAAIVKLSNGDISGSGLGLQIIGWVLGFGCFLISLSIARNLIWRSVLAAASSVGFIIAGGGGIVGMLGSLPRTFLNQTTPSYASGGLAVISFFFAFIMAIYTIFCFVWYARRPTFSLAISSKGGSDTPIAISGASGLGLFSVSAGKALTAEPAGDAEPMLQELGAVILDIQMLGDMGIDKWKAL
jgi:hypothetical protein